VASVRFEQPSGPIRREIRGASITLGRHPECDVQVMDKGVSKVHCKIHPRAAGAATEYWLQDLGSLNGTLLNGKPVNGEGRLAHGDRIQLGSAVAIFEDAREAPVVASEEEDERTSPVENGQLTVQRSGDLQVRLWNVAVGLGGFVVRIPLEGDRPPSSRMLTYPGKSAREELCLEPGDAPFEALLAQARLDVGALPERERVTYLTGVVYRTLGGRLTQAHQDACLDACRAFTGRRMPIGELIRLGKGVCRHRAFLFFHLARKLGLRVEIFRGAVADGRHAWNEVRIGNSRVFVDASLGVVLDGAQEAELAYGYRASRFPLQRPGGDPDSTRALVVGEAAEERVAMPTFRHELRKVPSDEEAVLLLYPEGALPEVRFLHVHLRAGPDGASMFALPEFLSARVFAVVGDEAHHLLDAIDPAAMSKVQTAWAKHPRDR
jgi:pSer/pThr/pTyr-binding forkhead associated (FHA) protein